MSPNHLELDQAIEELKRERPDDLRRKRSLDALVESRRKLRIPGLAAVGAIAFVAFLLFPTRGNGLAWAEVLRRTQQAECMHLTYIDDRGVVTGEQWRSGSMWALWIKDKTGRIICENRSDNRHFYSFLYQARLTAPNATQYGTVWNKTPQMLEGDKKFGSIQKIDDVLSGKEVKLIRQERVTAEGIPVQRYQLNMYGKDATVDADPKTGHILFIRRPGETEKFEYPEAIAQERFSFENRLTRNVAILDLRGKENPKSLPPYMPKPIASKGGIELRAISVNPEGDLYVFWTGYLPDKKAAKRLHVVGVKTGATRWLGYFTDGVHPVQGPVADRLICYRAELPQKIGDRLTIRIPTKDSFVEFENVPIKKPHALKD